MAGTPGWADDGWGYGMGHRSDRRRAVLWIVAIVSLWALAAAGLSGAATAATRVTNTYADAQSYMTTLTAPTPVADGRFGMSVGVDGDVAAVLGWGGWPAAVPSRVEDSVAAQPGVFVFDKGAAGWSHTATLTAPPSADPGEELLMSDVAISGQTVVWGVPNRGQTSFASGRALVHERVGGIWSAPVTLTPSGSYETTSGHFGSAVAIDGDTIVVGAPGNGSAHVFTRSGGVWSPAAQLVPDGWDGTQMGFGETVDVSGDTIAVAWPGYDSDSGAVFVYQGSGASWSRVATIGPPPWAGDWARLGTSLALSGDDLLAGTILGFAFGSSQRVALPDGGIVYAFRRAGGVWDSGTTITAPVPTTGDAFGWSLDAHDGVALISAGNPDIFLFGPEQDPRIDERAFFISITDKAHLFHSTASGWTHDATLTCAATDTGFGGAIALTGDSALVGAPGSAIVPPNSPARIPIVDGLPGAAYVFDLLGPNAAKNFTGVPASEKVTLSWSNPATDWARTKIMRSTTGYVESMASLRSARATGVQVYSGTGGVFANTGLTNGVLYYYSAFTQDPEGRYGPVAKTSARAGVASGSERLVLSLTTPGSPTEDEKFRTSGTFGPTHYVGAKITLWFWFWNGKSWVLYPIRPSSTVGSGSGSWRISTTLPWPGRWKVRAFHKDSWNSGQWSNTRSVWVNRDAGDLW